MAVFCAAAWPAVIDGSGFTYVVLAERGLFKLQQIVHPLYMPLLRGVLAVARAAGWSGGGLLLFQALSAASAAAAAAVYVRAARRRTSPGVAVAAALCAVLGTSGSAMLAQPKPYWPAALFLALYLSELSEEKPRTFRAGLWLGCAGGFTAAALGAAAGGLLLRGRRSFLGGLGTSLLVLAAVSWLQSSPLPFTGGWLSALSAGVSVFSGRGLGEQFRRLAGALLLSWPVLPALALLALRPPPAVLRLLASSAGLAAFFAVCDPENHFVWSVLFPVPLALCFMPGRLLLAPLAALSAAWAWASAQPARDDSLQAYRVEGEFLRALTASGGTIVCAGAPDWRLAYYYPDLPLTRLRLEGDQSDPFGLPFVEPEKAPRGEGVYLAADAFFNGRRLPDGEWEALQRRLASQLRPGKPVVSPGGQWYYRLDARK